MINKIIQRTEQIGLDHKLIRKTFQRGLQTIESVSAYKNNKLYFRGWRIDEYKHVKKLSQAYNECGPIKGSQSIVDYFA